MKKTSNLKIIWKILAGVSGLLIIGIILIIYNAFNGNFISGMYYKSKVDKYIAQTYPDKNYTVSNYSYSFKTGNYSFRITDPDSPDGCFNAYYSDYEKKVVDTYEDDVLHLNNTLMRLEQVLRSEVDPLIDKHLHTEEKEFGFATCMIGDTDYNSLKDRLTLDMKADAKNMPIPTQVILYFDTDETQSFHRVQKLANELKTRGCRIDYYNFSAADKSYEMVPAGRLLAAERVEELEEFVLPGDDLPKEKFQENAPTVTRPTLSTEAASADAPKEKATY